MNNFLGDLINRHQGNSDGREGFKVQPRPKARFENEPLIKANLNNDPSDGYRVEQQTQIDTEDGSLMTLSYPSRMDEVGTEKIQSTQSAVPIIQTPDQSTKQARGGDFIDTVNERVNILSAQVGEKQPEQQESLQATSNQATQQKQQVFSLTEESQQSASTESLQIGGLNVRIEEILQRLQNQQTPPIQNQNGLDVPSESGNAELSNQAITEPVLTLGELRPETLGRSISEPEQPENSQVDSPVIQQPGLLQIPTWLTQMQTDLNHRWQEINHKQEVEPVVNVTIGRIEVKAVNADSVKQPKPRNKPTGVMSLDDYLKQRESRGRA